MIQTMINEISITQHSPTPHRKNSLKAKQLNLFDIPKQNIKYSTDEMNQINKNTNPKTTSTPPKQYKNRFQSRTQTQPLTHAHITSKRNDLKEWELTLKMKE
eukprot:263008_1